MRAPIDPLLEILARKTLGAWMANRHQTLFPLAINLRRLEPAQAELLAQAIACAMLAAGSDAARLPEVRAWLRTVGGEETMAALLDAALAAPLPLPTLLDRIEAAKLVPQAFAVALAAVDQREPANRLFLDYLAARLRVPGDMARSLAQRFRS